MAQTEVIGAALSAGPTSESEISAPAVALDGAATLTDADAQESLVLAYVHLVLNKCAGQKGKPPDGMDAKGTVTTFIGAFMPLLVIAFSAEACNNSTVESEHGIMVVLGSFGAVATLLFAAPASPFCQPRNVIGGHVIACVTALCFDYLTEPKSRFGEFEVIPQSVSTALVTSLVIAISAKLGLTHPPAAACALIYISAPADSLIKALGWRYFAPVMLGNMIQLIFALLVNNAVFFRSYPVYW